MLPRRPCTTAVTAEHKHAVQQRIEREQQRQQQKTRSRDDGFGMGF